MEKMPLQHASSSGGDSFLQMGQHFLKNFRWGSTFCKISDGAALFGKNQRKKLNILKNCHLYASYIKFVLNPTLNMGQHFTWGAGPGPIMGQQVLAMLVLCRRL